MAVVHKGSITMGLVLIPIGMYKATVDNDTPNLNQALRQPMVKGLKDDVVVEEVQI